MMRPRVPIEQITLRADDGRHLGARWWPGEDAEKRTVVFLPCMAAPSSYLRWVAGYLAERGWGVLTFDYRGIGSSRAPGADRDTTLDHWVELDLPAALAEVRRRADPDFIGVIAHSIGGQLLGMSPIRRELDGALFIAAQRGIPRLFTGMGRIRAEYAYCVFPLLIRLLGSLPPTRLTLPEPAPNGAILQWIRWGRTGVFTTAGGVDVESRFADFHAPLIALTIADDHYYGTPASVRALTRLYTGSAVEHVTIAPEEHGVTAIGHFGVFKPRVPRTLLVCLDAWLRKLEARRSAEAQFRGLVATPYGLRVDAPSVAIH